VPGEASTGGAAFGTLVHAVLAQAPYEASAETLADLARLEARVLGLSDRDADVAAAKVARVQAHELWQRASRAAARGACRRETPITLTLPDGRLVEGFVDLAFDDGDGWVAVDYKTDRELANAENDYRRQVATYAAAIRVATGRPATGALVRV